MIPIAMEKITAIIVAGQLIATGAPLNCEMSSARITPMITPSTPPIDVSATASVRN